MKVKLGIFLLVVFAVLLFSCNVKPPNQVSVFELLNGIRDKANVEGYDILEYELYDVPGNESTDFQTFIRNYTKTLEEYVFDWSYPYWLEDNTELSTNVKTIMTNNKRNLSTTKHLNPDGSTNFIFNCLNSNGKYEFYSIIAYKKNMSVSTKTKGNFVRHDFAEGYIRQGWAYYWKEDYDKAIAYFTEALRLDPKNTEVYNIRGWVHYSKRAYDQAVSDFTELIRFNPKSAEAYYKRGRAQEDHDKAIADYTKAIRLDPKFTVAYSWRGNAYYGKKDYNHAIADFSKVIQLDQKNAEANYLRGMAYFCKEDYDRAISDFTEAIRLDQKNAETYIWRGRAYSWKEDYDRSIADYTEAIRLDPKSAWAYSWRGDVHYDNGDYNQAILDYETSLLIDPSDPDTKQNLEDARQTLQLHNVK